MSAGLQLVEEIPFHPWYFPLLSWVTSLNSLMLLIGLVYLFQVRCTTHADPRRLIGRLSQILFAYQIVLNFISGISLLAFLLYRVGWVHVALSFQTVEIELPWWMMVLNPLTGIGSSWAWYQIHQLSKQDKSLCENTPLVSRKASISLIFTSLIYHAAAIMLPLVSMFSFVREFSIQWETIFSWKTIGFIFPWPIMLTVLALMGYWVYGLIQAIRIKTNPSVFLFGRIVGVFFISLTSVLPLITAQLALGDYKTFFAFFVTSLLLPVFLSLSSVIVRIVTRVSCFSMTIRLLSIGLFFQVIAMLFFSELVGTIQFYRLQTPCNQWIRYYSPVLNKEKPLIESDARQKWLQVFPLVPNMISGLSEDVLIINSDVDCQYQYNFNTRKWVKNRWLMVR